MEPVVAVQPEHRRLRRPQHPHGDPARRPRQGLPERPGQPFRELRRRPLVQAADDEPGQPLVRRVLVQLALFQLALDERRELVLGREGDRRVLGRVRLDQYLAALRPAPGPARHL